MCLICSRVRTFVWLIFFLQTLAINIYVKFIERGNCFYEISIAKFLHVAQFDWLSGTMLPEIRFVTHSPETDRQKPCVQVIGFIKFKVNESRYKQCGVNPHFSTAQNLLRTYWEKNILRKDKYCYSQLRKAFIDPLTINNPIYRDSLTLTCTFYC